MMKAMDIRTAFKASIRKRKRRASDGETETSDIKTAKLNAENANSENSIASHAVPNNILTDIEKGLNPHVQNTKPTVDEDLNSSQVSNSSLSKVVINNVEKTDSERNGNEIELVEVSSDSSSDDDDVQLVSSTPNSLNVSVSSNVDSKEPASPLSQSESSESEPLSGNDQEVPATQNCTNSTSPQVQTAKVPKKRKRMSAEQAKLKEEQRARKLKEKEQLLAAKKAEREQLKEKKEEERRQKKAAKEIERKEKERLRQEKKEQEEQRKQQEKEEKNRIKQQLLETKAEEKRKKEEEKKRIEEEKRQAEEEKKRIQMEKERKAKEAFQNFFKKSGFSINPSQTQEKTEVFLPFQVSKDMALAPIIPPAAQARFNKEELDNSLQSQGNTSLYLEQLKSRQYKSICYRKNKTKHVNNDNEVIIVSGTEKPYLHLRAKLLQFCENIRPAYFGTWRKKSVNVSGRRPFSKEEILDYEVESDEEWDEGGPGESIEGTEDEESEDDYEVDHEFFVPHGYLSAEEEGDEEDETPTDPEELKTRLKMKENEFLSERKKKTTELKPIILGCFFEGDSAYDSSAAETFLKPCSAELLTTLEIPGGLSSRVNENAAFENAEKSSPANDGSMKTASNVARSVPEEAMPFLIRLLHANTNSRNFVMKEFQQFWKNHCKKIKNCAESKQMKNSEAPTSTNNALETTPETKLSNSSSNISKRQLAMTIQNISTWGKCPSGAMKRWCWWVKDDILAKYGSTDVPVPNQWDYTSSAQDTAEAITM